MAKIFGEPNNRNKSQLKNRKRLASVYSSKHFICISFVARKFSLFFFQFNLIELWNQFCVFFEDCFFSGSIGTNRSIHSP